jgi:hypothetical protein
MEMWFCTLSRSFAMFTTILTLIPINVWYSLQQVWVDVRHHSACECVCCDICLSKEKDKEEFLVIFFSLKDLAVDELFWGCEILCVSVKVTNTEHQLNLKIMHGVYYETQAYHSVWRPTTYFVLSVVKLLIYSCEVQIYEYLQEIWNYELENVLRIHANTLER